MSNGLRVYNLGGRGLIHQTRSYLPSPLAGEGWGEGEIVKS